MHRVNVRDASGKRKREHAAHLAAFVRPPQPTHVVTNDGNDDCGFTRKKYALSITAKLGRSCIRTPYSLVVLTVYIAAPAADEIEVAKSPPRPPTDAQLLGNEANGAQQPPMPSLAPVSEIHPSIKANSVHLKWKDNSCSIDASIVAMCAAVGGIQANRTQMNVQEIRELFNARMTDASLGEPLRYGVQQDIQLVLPRLCRMCGIATHCELGFSLRNAPTDMSDACEISVLGPPPVKIESLVVAGLGETMSDIIQQRIDGYAQRVTCKSFQEVQFRTPARYIPTLHSNVWVDADTTAAEREAFRVAHLHITGKPVGLTYQCDPNVKCGNSSGMCHGMCSFRCRQTVETKQYHFSVACSGQRWHNAFVKEASDVLIVHVTPIPGANARLQLINLVVDGVVQLYNLRSIIQKSGHEGIGHFRTVFAGRGYKWYVHDGLRNDGKPIAYANGVPTTLTSPRGALNYYYDVVLVYIRMK